MEIHIFIAHMGIGGAERVCVNLANEFSKNNNVHIVVLNLDNDIYTHQLDSQVMVHELGCSRLRYSFVPILRYIKRNKPEFLLVFGNEMGIILNKLKKLHLINIDIFVRVLNNLNISLDKEDSVSVVVERYLQSAQKQLADMSGVICQCQAMKEMLIDKNILPDDKVNVIYNPVSSSLISQVDSLRENQQSSSKGRITFIGRIDPQKQPEHLLKAMSIIHRTHPDAVLRIVGDGVLLEQMKTETDSLGLNEYVIFDGIRKDMENVYSESDVVILSSKYEGMPNSLIEAIGCGIPVVSYDCPIGPSEIIIDGTNGYLVKQNDIEDLAQKIILALDTEWDSVAIKQTCSKFDVKNICESYYSLFRSVTCH